MSEIAGLSETPRGFKQELAAMVRLALPVVVVQVGLMFMGVVDALMVGRVSAGALAAAALGNLYFYGVSIFGVGLLMALDPIVAQAVGARDEPAIARGVQRAVVVALGLSVVTTALLWFAEPVLARLGQPAHIVPVAASYARAVAPAMLPFYLFVVLRQTLQAKHRLKAIVAVVVLANIANAGLNWVFIFGHFGVPALGVVGAGIATAIGRFLMPPLLLAFAWRDIVPHLHPWRPDVLRWLPLRRTVALGIPIGLQMELEYGGFAVAGLMTGWMGTAQLAGHQVALNLASLAFMVPMGVSSAAAVLVGNAIGRADTAEARRAAWAAVTCGVAFMSASALVMLSFPGLLARVYSSDAGVIAVAAALLPIAGVFQVFDGLQVVSIGILRGAGDTRTPMIVNLLGYWALGLPVSWLLGLRLQMGPQGVWWGLTVGLATVALILVLRVRAKLSSHVGRVVIDHPEPAAAAGLQRDTAPDPTAG